MHSNALLSKCMVILIVLVGCIGVSCSESLADIKTNIQFKHKPIAYFVPEHRIRLAVEVEATERVKLVRCYFKAQAQADYVFVPMRSEKGDQYACVLPAPREGTEFIDYLFLAVTAGNRVYRTQNYRVAEKDVKKIPGWQEVTTEGVITVSTELQQSPSIKGNYADSIEMDIVESSLRFGMVNGLGIYTASEIAAAGGLSGSAASAAGMGTVAASSGISTTTVVGAIAAVAAGVAAAAVGAGGGGGGGDSPNGLPCNETIMSGSNEPVTKVVELGRKAGQFLFDYDTGSVADRIIVNYGGKEWNSGCIATKTTRHQTFSYSGSSQVTVHVEPNCKGAKEGQITWWSFTVHCPQAGY